MKIEAWTAYNGETSFDLTEVRVYGHDDIPYVTLSLEELRELYRLAGELLASQRHGTDE